MRGHIERHVHSLKEKCPRVQEEVPQMPLTDVQIKQLQPKEKPYKIFDGGGLYIEVFPDGAKRWRYKYQLGDKEKLLVLDVKRLLPRLTIHKGPLSTEIFSSSLWIWMAKYLPMVANLPWLARGQTKSETLAKKPS